jgi:hypothetical protein
MKRLLLLALLLTGCGAETKGVTATPTRTATPTPTVKPASPAERATAKLRNYLGKNTQEMRRRCVPADELPMDAIAVVDCDFRGGAWGAYLMFDSESDLEDYFGLVTAASKRIRGHEVLGGDVGAQGARDPRLARAVPAPLAHIADLDGQ